MYQCPRCNEEIERLNTRQDAVEFGGVDIIGRFLRTDGRYDPELDNWETEDTDSQGNCEYRCPHCEETVSLSDLIWIEENPTPTPTTPTPARVFLEEASHDVVHRRIGERPNFTGGRDIRTLQVECPECHVLIVGSEVNEEAFIDCPNGHTLDMETIRRSNNTHAHA